jgi:hypothetical protein
MYLHIGGGVSVKEKDIIGIFDLDTATVSAVTKKFISVQSKEGRLEYDDSDLPRSFLLIGDKKNNKIKLSRISTQGLRQRGDPEYKGVVD